MQFLSQGASNQRQSTTIYESDTFVDPYGKDQNSANVWVKYWHSVEQQDGSVQQEPYWFNRFTNETSWDNPANDDAVQCHGSATVGGLAPVT